MAFAQMIKVCDAVVPAGYASTLPVDMITKIGIDSASVMVSEGETNVMSLICDMLTTSLGCTEITKEEFYN